MATSPYQQQGFGNPAVIRSVGRCIALTIFSLHDLRNKQ